MKKLFRAYALLCLAVLPAAACIEDPTALEEGEFPLSEAEIRLLGLDIYQSILDAREVGLGVGSPAAAGEVAAAVAGTGVELPTPGLSPVAYNERTETTVDCPGGGLASLAMEIKGVVNEDSDAGWVRLTLTFDWEACAAEGPDGPVRNGAPFVETVLYATSDGTEVDLEGTIRGGVRVEANGESALCVVRMELEGWDRVDGSSYTRTWGSVCGEDFDEETRTDAAG